MWQAYLTLFLTYIVSLPGYQISSNKEPMEETTAPKYLYKILSLRNWLATQSRKTIILSAEDDAFIHFSKEEQLEKIITKYWSSAPQYVVLKIDTSKLQGKMVFESNPGGSGDKYYHLYQGFIPLEAIAESNVVHREPPPLENVKTNTFKVVEIGDPVLRQTARALSEKEILSPEIQNLIYDMTTSLRTAPGVGLAAPQIGKSIQLIVVEDMEHGHLTPEQLVERDRFKVPFHVIINPKIIVEEIETVKFFEGCLSVPVLLGIVPRAKSVRVECLNEHAQAIVIHARGWYARILQHEIDHLHGILFIDRAISQTLMTEENYVKLWKVKKASEAERILCSSDCDASHLHSIKR